MSSESVKFLYFFGGPQEKYGAPISRRRVYLLMIRRDVMTDEVLNQDFVAYISKKLDDMKVSAKCGWFLTSTVVLRKLWHVFQ